MAHHQQKIKATYLRGGTSKGVFFNLQDLPEAAAKPGPARDALLLRVVGSPDPYGKQIDGMGNGSSSTSKCVLVGPSQRADHDVDYLFAQIAIDRAFVDYSGNCGNLSAAVGAFALHSGLIAAEKIPQNGVLSVRIWQANIQKTIIAHVPIADGELQETGDFELDGVTFPAAEVVLEFLDPADEPGESGAASSSGASQTAGGMFPTGKVLEDFLVPGFAPLQATFINAGIPTIFLRADQLGLNGTELQEDINTHPEWLQKFEVLRAHGALQMRLINTLSEAQTRQHTPKIAFVSPPKAYVASSGKSIALESVDLLVRALSMGKLHHAMMGTCAVAIGAAAAVPGTLVNLAAGGGALDAVRFGHPSGTLRVGAEAQFSEGVWTVSKAVMSRSARIIMEGWVRVPR